MGTDTVETVLRRLNQEEPPARLIKGIFSRIDAERRRLLLIRRVASISAASLSLAGFAAGAVFVVRDFRQSGFGRYLSLMLTDGKLMLSFWGDFISSLAESLPIFSLAACLISLFFFLAAVRWASRNFNGSRGLARPA
jgi:hypothetical protein